MAEGVEDGNGNFRLTLDLEADEDRTVMSVEPDFDSSFTPSAWFWFMVDGDTESNWYKLTYEEIASVRDYLNRALENWDARVTSDERVLPDTDVV